MLQCSARVSTIIPAEAILDSMGERRRGHDAKRALRMKDGAPQDAAAAARGRSIGAALVTLAVGATAVSDMCAKLLAENYATTEIVFWRAAIAGALLAVSLLPRALAGRTPRRIAHPGLQILRGALAAAAVGLFFWGLAQAPFANAVAVAATAPLFMAILGWAMLGEPVQRALWPSLALGAAGVWLIVHPEAPFGDLAPYAAVLASSLCYALVAVTTRRMGGADGPRVTALVTYLVTIAAAGALLLLDAPQAPALGDAPLLAALGLSGAVAMAAYAWAYDFADVSSLAPWDNMIFPWALFLGLVVFSEVPDAPALAGVGLVMASGLLISLWRA
jgi:drug/metabolite transporter (DMT)-like permease